MSMILKKILTLKHLLIIRIVFGLYYDTSSSLFIRYVTRLYCIVYCVFAVVIIFSGPMQISLFMFTIIPKFVFNILFSLYFKSKFIINFYSDLIIFDNLSKFEFDHFNVQVSCIGYLIISIMKSGTLIVSQLYDIFSIRFLALLMIQITNYLSYSTNIFIYNLLWTRMKHLRKSFYKNMIFKNRNESFDEKCRRIKKFTHNYKIILDSVARANSGIKLMIFISLVNNVFKVTFLIYFSIKNFIKEGFQITYMSQFIEGLLGTILMCQSAVFAEMVVNEYDQIKEILADQLLFYDDEDTREEILTCLYYIETRPPKYTIYRMFPLDLSLVTGIVDVCVTYIIVLLQFDL